MDGEKEHEAQAHKTRSSTSGCVAANRRPVMTCPYRILGNHRLWSAGSTTGQPRSSATTFRPLGAPKGASTRSYWMTCAELSA